MDRSKSSIIVRNTRPEDFAGIIKMTEEVYPTSRPWSEKQLSSHLRVFPEGQLVAVDTDTNDIVGMAASLIVLWEDYAHTGSWREFTDGGMFTNHDPEDGRTLYGAEVMTHPKRQRMGIGHALYVARREITRKFRLKRIRAGGRLRGYVRYAEEMTAIDYVTRVVRGELKDPTLTFQMREGFDVIAVVADYLGSDPASQGYAALIEWINEEVATARDYEGRDLRFKRP